MRLVYPKRAPVLMAKLHSFRGIRTAKPIWLDNPLNMVKTESTE